MAEEKLLTLTEYSNQYKVSISTLRRRIKSDRVEYVLRDGKYFISDKPLRAHNVTQEAKKAAPTSSNNSTVIEQVVSAPAEPANSVVTPSPLEPKADWEGVSIESPSEAAMMATANELLAELKRAYALILQEKEEQILNLKEEVADLKTLVRVLEAENERLKTNVTEAAPIDSWLGSLGELDLEPNS